DQTSRKPLVLRGARQVGKTHTVRQLGKQFSHFIEINFELMPQYKSLFVQDLDPKRILKELSMAICQKIQAGNTLLFFDEVQENPQAI
ncbi:AAA family ATPase, partial [Acinetobacter baumannii]